MKTWKWVIGISLVLGCAQAALAAEWFVATNGSDAAAGTNWATAKLTIQAGIDAAASNDTVWVSNGVYAGLVTVNNGILLQSVNGADFTTIQGSSSRCVTLSNAAAVVSGFTLTGGTADWGGGAYIDAGTLENCKIHDNVASGRTHTDCDPGGSHCVQYCYAYGGGVYGGTLRNCDIYLNQAQATSGTGPNAAGGGTYQSDLSNCSVRNNRATAESYSGASAKGGGTFAGVNRNCTIVGNYAGAQAPIASASGGGCNGSANYNSIIYANTSMAYPNTEAADNVAGGSSSYSCAPGLSSGTGNITSDPQFVAAAAGNYRLATNSPCIDAGNNADVAETTDLDGDLRIVNGTVDMGAYESGHVRVPAAWYVATNGSDSAAGTNWTSAKLTIQAAVDLAADGDTIWVSNGVYASGGGRAVAETQPNRVVIDRPATVQSVNGPEVTFIVGGGMRCVYVANGAVLSGFTLTNGTTSAGSCGLGFSCGKNQNGGGAYCEADGVLTNCILTGNTAANEGGGAAGGILNNCRLIGNSSSFNGGGSAGSVLNHCVLTSNTASYVGGGAYGGTLSNCLLTGNHASYGAGAGLGTLYNCTVSGNPGWDGGGVIWSTVKNGIVYGNTGDGDKANYQDCTFTNCCTLPLPGGGTGNITNDPQFVDSGAGNYRLSTNSPCIDAGDNAFVSDVADLDGNPRVVGIDVDLGAYEWQGGTVLSLHPASTNLPGTAASGLALGVTANIGWTAVTNVSWLTITSGGSGTTNGTVIFDVAANEGTSVRTGTIVVEGGGVARTCTVLQAAFVSELSILPASTNLPGTAASGLALGVTANIGWTAVTNVSWLTITSGGSGTTNGTVIFDVTANEGTAARTGTIVVVGGGVAKTCTVVQAAFETVLTMVHPGTNLPYGATADVTIGVTANVSWTAGTNVSWLTITSGESGISNGVVVFSAAANEDTTERIGGIVLTGGGLVRTCTVVQAYEGQVNTGYDVWALAITNGMTGPAECATGDGVPNLLKYATGSSATQADDYAFLVASWSNRVKKFSFYRNTNAWDVTIYLQRSSGISNGATWINIATNVYGAWNGAKDVSESGSGNPVWCLYQDSEPLPTNRYLRLKVTMP